MSGPSLGEIKNAIADADTGPGVAGRGGSAARANSMSPRSRRPSPTLVLPLDQAEELFGSDAGERGAGVSGLLLGVADGPGPAGHDGGRDDPLGPVRTIADRAAAVGGVQTACSTG